MNMISNKYGKFLSHTWISCIQIIIIVMAMLNLAQSQVIKENDENLDKIDVIENLNEYIPMDLEFTDDKAQTVKLSDYFNQAKPVVMVLGYYKCPMLCNLVFNGLTNTARELDWSPGVEYKIITVSINPEETWELARDKKANYLTALDKPSADTGWSFLVGEKANSEKLADAVGFKYFYDENQKQYAHPAVIILLSEDGKITRYLYGIEHNIRDFKFAIQEASEGKIGSTIDKIILYCFHYDPDSKGYVVFAGNIMKLGGLFTVFFMVIILFTLFRRERSRKKNVTAVRAG